MTREEALEELDSLLIPRDGEQDKLADAFEMAIKALSQQTEDAISRQAVLDIIEDRIKNGLAQNVAISQYYHMEVKKLPSVNPQDCDTCEVGNPCMYCKHEFEPQESEVDNG